MSVIDNLFGSENSSWPTRILTGLLAAGVVFGWLYYSRNHGAQETHDRMIAACGSDTACVNAVNKYADECFKDNYHMGRRRQNVSTDDFVSCVNQKSGVHYFSVKKP